VRWALFALQPGDALTPSEGITTFNTCTLISQISAEMLKNETIRKW